MRLYIFRRLVVAVPSLLIASLIVFTLPRLIPGDVVQLMLDEKAYGKDLDDLRAKLGLNRPLHVQYIEWLGAVVRGHLGESLWTRQPVISELARRLPVTATLGVMATIVAIVIGVPIGVVAATRQDGVVDFFARSTAIFALSIPGFVLAILVTLLPAIWWGWTPPRFVEFSKDPAGNLIQFLLPALILGIASAAAIMRLTRGMLLEVLRQDYVRTAWAKGLRERVVVVRHALKNAMLPVITLIGTEFAFLIGGLVVTETVFTLNGVGRFVVDAVAHRDYPVVQALVFLIASGFVVVNLLVDLTYAWLDPRIRYR